jgi:preprotein translocase subunit SecG
MNIIIALSSFVLILLCLFTLLVVMVQKPKGDGGLGAALGGGSMEAALGAETGSLLTKITIYAVIGFFVLSFALYLGSIASKNGALEESGGTLLSEIAGESSDDATSAPDAASALQQVLQLSEETAPDASEEAADVAQEVEAAAGEIKTEAEEVPNP